MFLSGAHQCNLVKIVTGPRRCGKTYLLNHLFHYKLKEEGAFSSRLILSGTRWLKPFRTFLFQMIIQASR